MTTAIASRVDRVAKRLALTQEDLGKLVGASPRAVSRWRAGESIPQKMARRRLLELVYVGDQLSKVLRPDDANLWMFSRNPLLDGDTPAERVERGEFASVLAVIEALAEGVVA